MLRIMSRRAPEQEDAKEQVLQGIRGVLFEEDTALLEQVLCTSTVPEVPRIEIEGQAGVVVGAGFTCACERWLCGAAAEDEEVGF